MARGPRTGGNRLRAGLMNRRTSVDNTRRKANKHWIPPQENRNTLQMLPCLQ